MEEDFQRRFEDVVYRASLVLPRLRGVETAGDGALIHAVRGFISRIDAWKGLTEWKHSNLEKYLASVEEAEAWLIEHAKQL